MVGQAGQDIDDKTLVDGVKREEIGIQQEEFMIGNLGAIDAPNNLSGKSFHIIPFVFLCRLLATQRLLLVRMRFFWFQ